MSDYTPTTAEVRDAATQCPHGIPDAEFDRWLEAHDREVKAQAWQEGYADCMDYHMSNGLKGAEENPYKEEA